MPVEQADTISPEAFEEIVRQQQRRVYRVLLMLVRDPDTADTLTQECFLRAYKNRVSFRGECRVDTWILRIAVNLARDHGKNRRAAFWRKLVGLEDQEGSTREVAARQASPEQALLAREELAAVLEATASLSPQQRTIFLMRFSEEMPLAEIADVLGLRTGSVKTQLSRAVGKVRSLMKERNA
jgi:RNA polymerase sigma-70 factor, ECF subfamily